MCLNDYMKVGENVMAFSFSNLFEKIACQTSTAQFSEIKPNQFMTKNKNNGALSSKKKTTQRKIVINQLP